MRTGGFNIYIYDSAYLIKIVPSCASAQLSNLLTPPAPPTVTQCVQPLVHPTGLSYVERPLARQQLGSASAAMTRDLADRSVRSHRGFRCGDVQGRLGGAGGVLMEEGKVLSQRGTQQASN